MSRGYRSGNPQRELPRPAPPLLREIFFDSYDLVPGVSNLQSRYGAILMRDKFHWFGAPKGYSLKKLPQVEAQTRLGW